MLEIFQKVIYFLLVFTPFLFFYLGARALWETWVDYVQTKYDLGLTKRLLEIKMPKEITKSPLAMELVFNSFFDTSKEGNWHTKYVKGTQRSQFSLEIISEGGNIRFFIRLEDRFKDIYTSHIYSQYPSVEIIEVADYAKFVKYHEGLSVFGGEFKHTKADPLPIKTYDKFQLDKAGIDVEEKIDPISNTLELMSSIRKDETVWVQIVCRAHKDEISVPKSEDDRKDEKWWEIHKLIVKNKKVNWKKEGEDMITKIREGLEEDLEEKGKFQRVMTPEQKETIAALEENMSKPAFDTGIRVVYLTEGSFSGHMPGLILGLFKHLSSNTLNGFKPGFNTSFDFPWVDKSKKKANKMKEHIIKDYKRRKFFGKSEYYYTWYPQESTKVTLPKMVLSAAELATLYHPPSSVVQTPTFDRIDSKKSEAPANLPI